MSAKNEAATTNIQQGSDYDRNESHFHKHECSKSITELKETNKLMLRKLRLQDQTSQIQFRLLKKELRESKAEAKKRNSLVLSLFQELQPNFKTASSLEEILSGLATRNEYGKEYQQLQKPQSHRAEENSKNKEYLKIEKHMKELEQMVEVLKGEVAKLKKRDDHQSSLTLETVDDEEDLQPRKININANFPDNLSARSLHTEEEEEEEESEDHFLPSDTYSFLAVSDYFIRGRYCFIPTAAFAVACSTLMIQLGTLSVFTMDVVGSNNTIPPGVDSTVRVSQLIALFISCFTQDEVRASFNVLWLGYAKSNVRAISSRTTRFKFYFSLIARIFLGGFSLVVAFILIINSETVRDVMLDFAAVTFVSELDDGFFQLSQWGYMGKKLQQLTLKIANTPVYDKAAFSRMRKFPRLIWLSFLLGLVIWLWAWISMKQERGHYLDQFIFVQFGDDFSPAMGAFSGIYEIELDNTIDGMRVNYVELGERSDGRFYYCSVDGMWSFQYESDPDSYDDPLLSPCGYQARSSKTESYDLVDTSSLTWFVVDKELAVENPLQHFVVRDQTNYYGKSCESHADCGERMYCHHVDQTCACNDGLFGWNCEFPEPCQTLEIDSRDQNGFVGTRTWSRKYHSLQKVNETNKPIQVYGKPIYIGDESKEGAFDVMIFTGRRWILTDSAQIEEYEPASSGLSERHLADFLASNFHAYWSNYRFYFVSEAVDVGTPIDSATPVGLNWFRLGTRGARLHSGKEIWQEKTSIEAKLFCAHCNNETNPCFFGGVCNSDNTCGCTTGSSGTLCQIPPDGNGLCDPFFNTLEFDFDGGDCCEESCISTEEYVCGKAYVNTGGVSAYGFVGYEKCRDPRFSSKQSGSRTLFQIVERGTVRCGLGIFDGWMTKNEDGSYAGFEVDLCKAIAGAALSDPEAIELVQTTWPTRWDDFIADKFDVLLIPTTHTADRDVYQSDAELGYTFASHCYLFDGLMFGGIPQFTHCADNVEYDSVDCQDLKICSVTSTTWNNKVQELFPASKIVAVESVSAMYEALEAEHCNVITGELTNLAEFIVRNGGFTGPEYEIGTKTFSKEPMAAVTQQNDGVWSKFVSWTFHALVQAEESGITQWTAHKLAPTEVFGDRFRYMFRNAVAAKGNFGEIFHKHFEAKLPRTGLNELNNGTTGLLYAFPFGQYQNEGPDPIVGGTMDTIKKRGSLNCGFVTNSGFAELDPSTNSWKGFSVDICRGIAAALLGGAPNVNYVSLTTAERFEVLAAGTVDVLMGATHTLEREVNEATTGLGFDFSPPIFYDGLQFAGSRLPAMCADELDFGSRNPECSNTTICVPDGTTWLNEMRGVLGIPEENILVTKLSEESYQRMNSGECNVVAGETVNVAKSTVLQYGWPVDEDYYVGTKKHTKEPLGIVSRSNDAQFSDFLRWIMHALVHAEEQIITREDYFDMPIGNNLFGGALSAMWQHAISVVGNYGEIFERNFEGILERGGQNKLNNNGGPQAFALPGVAITVEQDSE